MKVCIPAATGDGFGSNPYGHFGSAPFFVVHDLDTDSTEVWQNANQHHEHGGCNPVGALGAQSIDAVIVGGIGARAIQKLNASGIRVYRAATGSIQDNVEALKAGRLPEFAPGSGCQGHDDCGH